MEFFSKIKLKGDRNMVEIKKFALVVCVAMLTVSGFSAEKIKVAIYKEDSEGIKTYGETGIYDTLKETSDIGPEYIPEMTPEKLKDFDVLIITKKGWNKTDYKPENWKENVRKWVQEGHGVVAMHETAGCSIPAAKRHYKWDLFPEIGKGYRVLKGQEIVMSVGHPITKNAAPNISIPNQVFRQGFSDYMIFTTGKDGNRVALGIRNDVKSKKLLMTQPVILAGAFGKGRVVLNGMLTGFDPNTGLEKIPSGAERHILLDVIRWLIGKKTIKKVAPPNFYIGSPLGSSDSKWAQSPDGLVLEKTMSTEQLVKLNKAFLDPILAKVNPPKLAKDIAGLSIGILEGGKSKEWFDSLKKAGCNNVKTLTPKEIEEGLAGISVLVIANALLERKYVPVIKAFLDKGGKLLATEGAGYDSKNGKFYLTETLNAGTYIDTVGVEYFSLFMPEEFKRKEVDKRRGELIIEHCKTAMKNGAAGMSYFTVANLLKPQSGRLDISKQDSSILKWNLFEDHKKEVEYVTRMSPFWKSNNSPVLKNLPFMPQIGYFGSRHIQIRDVDPKALAEDLKEIGINILTVQFGYVNRFFTKESEKGHVTVLREKILDRLEPELKKRGIHLWVNIFPSRGTRKIYCQNNPDECMVNSAGETVEIICPVKGKKGYKYNFDILEKLFSKYPYISGISLDEPHILPNCCFCPSCKKLFQQMFPDKKMTLNSNEFRKLREYIWAEYYVKPYAAFLRKHRPRKGVLMLASPGHHKPNWSMNSYELANSGVQLFANENAQTRSQCMFDEIWAKYKLKFVPCDKLALVEKHPLLEGVDPNKIGKQAVKADVFHGANTLAYVIDDECSYPGIIASNDTSSVYFAFDPLVQDKFVVNALNWFIGNDHHDVPEGMVLVPAGKFKMKIPREEMTAGRLPDEMIEKEVFVDKFYLSKCEVTNKEYEQFDPKHQRSELSKGDDMPVTNISMADAKKYCNWRSSLEDLESVYIEDKNGRMVTDLSKNGYRLPTVSEWQKAATGPEYFKYAWGNVWWRANGRVGMEFNEGAVKVGSYFPNYYGLFDMTGNAWEWCEGYEKFPFKQGRICGGTWHSRTTDCRVNFYNFLKTNLRRCTIGFRCARNGKPIQP
jgi:formylglycine-generating enzyme required for sulfatase activity